MSITIAEPARGPLADMVNGDFPSGGRYELYQDMAFHGGAAGMYLDKSLGFDVYVVTGYEANHDLLLRQRKSQLSSAVLPPQLIEAFDRGGVMRTVSRMMIALDAEPWMAARVDNGVDDLFKPNAISSLTRGIIRRTDQLIDPYRSADSVEIVGSLAGPLPVKVIMDVLGLPEADYPALKAWSDAISPAATNPLFAIGDPEMMNAAAEAMVQLYNYFLAFNESEKARPVEEQNTVMRALRCHVGATDKEGKVVFTEEDYFDNFVLLLIAGHETTTRLIAGTTHYLMQNPELLDLVRREPEKYVNWVIEEGLRMVSPFQAIFRRVRKDHAVSVRSGGAELVIPPKSMVLSLLAEANRDSRFFSNIADKMEFSSDIYDPRRYDPKLYSDQAKRPPKHLGFGVGMHRCLGANLAHEEAWAALGRILGLPNLRPSPQISRVGDPERQSTTLFYSPSYCVKVDFDSHEADKRPNDVVDVMTLGNGGRTADGAVGPGLLRVSSL